MHTLKVILYLLSFTTTLQQKYKDAAVDVVKIYSREGRSRGRGGFVLLLYATVEKIMRGG